MVSEVCVGGRGGLFRGSWCRRWWWCWGVSGDGAWKLDRKALPDVNFEPQALQYVAPRTPIEETVAAIFDDLLGTSTVGVNDDFFALGGNSLSAARLVARVNSVLGERINIRDVFDASTLQRWPNWRSVAEERGPSRR